MDRINLDPVHLANLGQAKQLSVLVVDDSLEDLSITAGFLEGHHEFRGVQTARQAVDECFERLPDCVVLDYQLPQMDGLCLMTELRRNPLMKYVPIIMLTSFGSAETAVAALKLGMDDLLRKECLSGPLLLKAIEAAYKARCVEEAMDVERHALIQERQELMRRHRLFATFWEETSHQLLTNVSSVQEFVTPLLDGVTGDINDEQGKCLAMARGGCQDIHRNIDKVLSFTRLAENPGKLVWKAERLSELIEYALDSVQLEAMSGEVTMHTAFDAEPLIMTDQYVLLQILDSLLATALALSPHGGDISVGVKRAAEGHVTVTVLARCEERSAMPLNDLAEWQLKDSLENANASNYACEAIPNVGIQFSFDLMVAAENGVRSVA